MMADKAPLEISAGMRRVCRRFERWRKAHKEPKNQNRAFAL